ncbi:MAG: large-conductance mechanosensitive channel protein MscL [Ruminococcus sp.]|nr:large-conductance mechanosensitive channel protein MscL [Ruminococcus sp.]
MEQQNQQSVTPQNVAAKSVKKVGGFAADFKAFISRGNVLDMAVGVIIGGAFTAIVNSLVNDILTPIIGTFLFGLNFDKLGITIPWGNQPYINFGSFIQNIITFLLTALCLFIMIKLIGSFRRKNEEAPPEPPKPTVDQELLTEIRDLLKAQAENK